MSRMTLTTLAKPPVTPYLGVGARQGGHRLPARHWRSACEMVSFKSPGSSVLGRRDQQCQSSNQVTVRPPRRRQPHRAARVPRARGHGRRVPHDPAGHKTGAAGPLRSVTSTRTTPSPEITATPAVSPNRPDALCRTLLPNSSLTSKTAVSVHGWPGPSTPETNTRAARARTTGPASVTLSRTASPAIRAPAFPAACPRTSPGPGGHTEMHT